MTTALVLGGVRSGKSRYAEQLLPRTGPVTYVAPGPVPDGTDPEWADRIARHRADRPAHWVTLETADLVGAIGAATTPVLVDCLGTWLTSAVDAATGWEPERLRAGVLDDAVAGLVAAVRDATVDVVLVSNEVGMGVVPATASGRFFRDELGRVNARVGAVTDRLLLVVAGRVLDLTDAPVIGAP